MSLELVREVSREHPHLVQRNIGRTCYEHTVLLIEKLRAHGHEAFLMAKSPGEGQYVPPGFQRRIVTGFDGKEYVCSGVSHDAIWCDGKQFDTLGSANEYDRPIYRIPGSIEVSFDPASGPQIQASPIWNEIPPDKWRPNNPPLLNGNSTPPADPPPVPSTPSFPYPDENTAGKAFQRRVKQAYKDAGRTFPDPNDEDAFRHFQRFGYSSHEMPAEQAADKHIKELRAQLGAPPE